MPIAGLISVQYSTHFDLESPVDRTLSLYAVLVAIIMVQFSLFHAQVHLCIDVTIYL